MYFLFHSISLFLFQSREWEEQKPKMSRQMEVFLFPSLLLVGMTALVHLMNVASPQGI